MCTVLAIEKQGKQVHIVAFKPLKRFMIDMTRYKASNDDYGWMLTIIDVYSNFVWAFPMKNKSDAEVVKNITFLFYKLTGTPKILQSDNSKEFCKFLMDELIKEFKITFKHSRPRPLRQTVRYNVSIKR
jgi:transposase InsO family protein